MLLQVTGVEYWEYMNIYIYIYILDATVFSLKGSVTVTWHHPKWWSNTPRWPNISENLQLGFVRLFQFIYAKKSSTSTSVNVFFKDEITVQIKMITFNISPCATSRATYSCIKMNFFGSCLRHSWIAPIWAFSRTCWAMPGWIEAHWLVDLIFLF